MWKFLSFCEEQTQKKFPDYLALQDWASSEYPRFWQLFVRWSQLPFSGADTPPVVGDDCESACFFPSLRLNYARCLLRNLGGESDNSNAIVGLSENGERVSMSRRELRSAVEQRAAGLMKCGVRPGDRVVAVVRNTPEAVIACLASAAIGATWSSVAPDMGDAATVGRFKQLDPVLLFTHTGYTFHGTKHSLQERIRLLGNELTTLRTIVTLDDDVQPSLLRDDIALVSLEQLAQENALDMSHWADFPFNHPLFILFSSGTTGAPKCLMHGAGGTLIEQHKEHLLHCSLAGEKLYYHTSTGWTMWNWQLSTLACGTQIVVYDGSPTFPTQDSLLRIVDQEQVGVFGTSPTYLHALQQLRISPQEIGKFEHLHTIQSTGSILYDTQYDWIASHFKAVKVQSFSGGTDIVGCFVLGNPLLPIYRGEIQCVCLGLDVRAMTEEGLNRYGEGDLVCVNAFPSRPLGFFGDIEGKKFHDTYFAENPGMWTHGDIVQLKERGSARVLGRSDGTLNVRGVRIGPAEIYNIVLTFPEVLQALAVEQIAPREPGGSRLVLLLVLQNGTTLDRMLGARIKSELRSKGSPNHVPAVIVQVAGIPVTHSGKLSEKAVRDLLNGKPLSNRSAIKNPESLDDIARHPQLQATGST